MRVFWESIGVLGPIYRLVGKGLADAEIASTLNLTDLNVQSCIAWMMRFLKLTNREGLVLYASSGVSPIAAIEHRLRVTNSRTSFKSEHPLPLNIKVGDVLLDDRPQILQALGLESEPFSGSWSRVKTFDRSSLDHQVRAAGWNLFFIPGEVKAVVCGAVKTGKIENAVTRILKKVRSRNFNCLEVAAIDSKRFLGMRYAIVSAHSLHLQQTRLLDLPKERKKHETDARWARG
jgi:hypothetical protein